MFLLLKTHNTLSLLMCCNNALVWVFLLSKIQSKPSKLCVKVPTPEHHTQSLTSHQFAIGMLINRDTHLILFITIRHIELPWWHGFRCFPHRFCSCLLHFLPLSSRGQSWNVFSVKWHFSFGSRTFLDDCLYFVKSFNTACWVAYPFCNSKVFHSLLLCWRLIYWQHVGWMSPHQYTFYGQDLQQLKDSHIMVYEFVSEGIPG